jgi:hypothetical protein
MRCRHPARDEMVTQSRYPESMLHSSKIPRATTSSHSSYPVRTPEWVQQNPKKATRAGTRVLDGLREVGLLLIAFGPLETAINRTSLRDAAGFLMLFLGGGLALFAIALVLEWRRQDGL